MDLNYSKIAALSYIYLCKLDNGQCVEIVSFLKLFIRSPFYTSQDIFLSLKHDKFTVSCVYIYTLPSYCCQEKTPVKTVLVPEQQQNAMSMYPSDDNESTGKCTPVSTRSTAFAKTLFQNV